MHIAFVLTQSLESPSGGGRYWPLARELVKTGQRVSLIVPHHDWSSAIPRHSVRDGVDVWCFGQMHVRKVGPRKEYFSPLRLLWVSWQGAINAARLLRHVGPDVIHLCKPQPINALAVKLGRREQLVFCDCDDYEAQTNRFSGEWQRRMVTYFEDGVVRYAAGLTVNTRFTLERYATLGFPPDRIKYVPNGVERARFTRPTNSARLREKWHIAELDPVIGYVGTIGLLSHPVDLLLTAFAQIVQMMPHARLLIVGGGEDFDHVQNLARQLNIDRRTVFTGYVVPDEVPDYLALTKVTVDPVRDDLIARARSPLKVLESLALGVPVVTGDVGERRELLRDGQLGMLVQPGDSDALAAGLVTLLEQPDRRQAMARLALAQREHWYWDQLVQEFAQIYEVGRD